MFADKTSCEGSKFSLIYEDVLGIVREVPMAQRILAKNGVSKGRNPQKFLVKFPVSREFSLETGAISTDFQQPVE